MEYRDRFFCPNCNKKYIDTNEKYLKKCNKNKTMRAIVKCICKQTFYVTISIYGTYAAYLPLKN